MRWVYYFAKQMRWHYGYSSQIHQPTQCNKQTQTNKHKQTQTNKQTMVVEIPLVEICYLFKVSVRVTTTPPPLGEF
jgi:hypothetical protein